MLPVAWALVTTVPTDLFVAPAAKMSRWVMRALLLRLPGFLASCLHKDPDPSLQAGNTRMGLGSNNVALVRGSMCFLVTPTQRWWDQRLPAFRRCLGLLYLPFPFAHHVSISHRTRGRLDCERKVESPASDLRGSVVFLIIL